MALGQKLMMRQSQSLVMTPQLLQAIKLLQLSTTELQAFVETELERNPLLERDSRDDEGPIAPDAGPMEPARAEATPGEIHHACAWLLSQAQRMTDRARQIRVAQHRAPSSFTITPTPND
jgi:DNA-directed RNA polymerase specialized sigma54-like protein